MATPPPATVATTEGNKDRENSDQSSLPTTKIDQLATLNKGTGESESFASLNTNPRPSRDDDDQSLANNSSTDISQNQQQHATNKSRSRKRTDRTRKPTPEEALHKLLRARNLYEPATRSALRNTVLAELEAFLQSWVDRIPRAPTSVTNQTVHVCTFGSYRLGVHNALSDIDVLCLTPSYVTRNDFFTSLVQMLEQHPEAITDLQPIPAAFTPVIKMKWKSIPIDLVFAHFADVSASSSSVTDEAYTLAEHLKGGEEEAVEPVIRRKDTNSSLDGDSLVSLFVFPHLCEHS